MVHTQSLSKATNYYVLPSPVLYMKLDIVFGVSTTFPETIEKSIIRILYVLIGY